MLLVIKDQTIINLIRQTEHIELDTEFRNLGQFLSCKHLAHGIMRGIDNDRFRL